MKLYSVLLAVTAFALQNFHSSAATLYVDLNSANPVPPYADWNSASTNIQDAADASADGDLILVTNGVYQTGAQLTSDGASNRVVVAKSVALSSVNGPGVTKIVGYYNRTSSIRCIYLTSGASMTGFMLTSGGTMKSGANVWCADSSVVVSNCIIAQGFAIENGGGAFQGTFFDCSFEKNNADQYGGGAYQSTLFNCVLTNNSASRGGGACSNTLVNCRLVNNFAQAQGPSGGGALYCTLNNCFVAGNKYLGRRRRSGV